MLKRILITLSLVLAFNAFADGDVQAPSTLEGGKIITAVDAKKLVDGKAAAFVDVRSVVNFGKGHIPGAQAVGYKENSDKKVGYDAAVDQFDLGKIPADKNAAVVFYSDGPTGWKSYKASMMAIKAGYKNVQWLREGFAVWTEKKFPIEQ